MNTAVTAVSGTPYACEIGRMMNTKIVKSNASRVHQQDTIDAMVAGALPSDWPLARNRPGPACIAAGGGCGTRGDRWSASESRDRRVSGYRARLLFTGSEPGLANAVLDRLADLLRTAEF